MSDVLSALRGVLLDCQPLVDLVGDRVLPDVLEQGAELPAVTIRRISTRHDDTIDGSVGGLAFSRVTVEAFAETRIQADRVAELVRRSGLLDWIGVRHGLDCRGVMVDTGAVGMTEPNSEGSHELRYITSVDYEIAFIEETSSV